MRRPDLRIRVQLTVSVCLFTIVCLVSLAVAIYVMSRNTLLNLQKGNLDLNSRLLREECHQEFFDLYNSFSRLAYSSPVLRMYNNHTTNTDLLDSANLLHESFGSDRILLMNLYLANGTKILEIDSKGLNNRSGLPHSLLPLSYAGSNMNGTLNTIQNSDGHLVGPVKASKPIGGTNFMLSLTLPVKTDGAIGQSFLSADFNNTVNTTIGYVTFLINCLKLQRILMSVSLSTTAKGIGTASLCSARDNFTLFDQLIPFDTNSTHFVNNTTALGVTSLYASEIQSRPNIVRRAASQINQATSFILKNLPSKSADSRFDSSDTIEIPIEMANELRKNKTPTALVNKGPEKSMISVSSFTVFNSTYYVVVLEDHKGVFIMPHHLRNIIIISSCAIGAGMIIFTFLFVSFGARQILRLKMAATYEQPAPTKWCFLPLPWWLRPSSPKTQPENSEKMLVPEKVPLRKHVRDELDDITERFNTMSNELRKQCARLEDRVEARKAEIEQAREAADVANAAKSHFLARVTHELRTPLNGIIGTATLCLEEANIGQIHQSLRTIFKCGELLLHLMTDLLSFSQNEVENLDLELRNFTIPEITSQLTAIFSEQCAAKKINLEVYSPEKYDGFVFRGDTNRILQVIFNLMSNGIKFTPEGGRVSFKTEVMKGTSASNFKNVVFFVEDNGPGIAPEMQSRVFEAFVQGDISSHVKKAGVGLGLSICKQLAERMLGTIDLTSEIGKGSMFTFKLPLEFRLLTENESLGSGHDSLDLSSAASILRHSSSNQGNSAGSTTASGSIKAVGSGPPSDLALPYSPELPHTFPDVSESTDPVPPKSEDVMKRNSSFTSQWARGLLSRRKTMDSVSRASKSSSNKKSEQHLKNEQKGISFSSNTLLTPRLRSMTVTSQAVSETSQNSAIMSISEPLPDIRADAYQSNSPNESKNESTDVDNERGNVKAAAPEPVAVSCASAPITSNSQENANSNTTQKPAAGFLDCNQLNQVMPDAHNTGASNSLLVRPALNQTKSYLGRPPSNLKVLVVDDNSVNQEVMMRMLNLEGLSTIKIANDGLDAITKVKEASNENSNFDVIFMDVQMPNMDGRQATRVIRNELEINVPIVAVSAFANEKNADDCIKAGMNLFLSKPLRRPHLREILRSLTSITATSTLGSEGTSEPAK